MVSELDLNHLHKSQPNGTAKNISRSAIAEIESLIGLIRKGDASSLSQASEILGITTGELSTLVGVSEDTLKSWKIEATPPPRKYLITWRLKLGDYVEEKIASCIGTSDPDLIHQFWEIMWRLNDLALHDQT